MNYENFEENTIENYPVICFYNPESNQKVFLIPNAQVLKDLGRKEKDDTSQLIYGADVLSQLISYERKIPSIDNSYTIYEYKRDEMTKLDPALQLLDFERKTLIDCTSYDMYFVMDSTPLNSLSERDVDTITQMTIINQQYKRKKATIN